jgi:SAM-dependent methyltransferase
MPAAPRIRYARTTRDWHGDYLRRVQEFIVTSGARRVCELGAGANPALALEFVEEHELEYVVTDADPVELQKAPAGYEQFQVDLCARDFEPPGVFDLAFSASVAEHIAEPSLFHRNIGRLLDDGGRAMHLFSTLYALPFVVNRLLPEKLGHAIVQRLDRFRAPDGKHAKFPAYYRWCRGPTRLQLERLEGAGFRVDEYVGLFGHFYYDSVPLIQRVEDRAAEWLVDHPAPWLTSYAFVVLTKQSDAQR